MNLAYHAIKVLDVPEDCLEIHEEFLENFPRFTINQLNEKVGDIIDENEDYGTALVEIMKILDKSPKIAQYTNQDQYLKEFEGNFRQYKAFMVAKEAF
jgi:hypothetical protein